MFLATPTGLRQRSTSKAIGWVGVRRQGFVTTPFGLRDLLAVFLPGKPSTATPGWRTVPFRGKCPNSGFNHFVVETTNAGSSDAERQASPLYRHSKK